MIRILTSTEPDGITVTVDGRLVGENVEAVESCVTDAIGEGKPVHLFLRDVSSIDRRGHALLGRMAATGVRLRAAGVYCSWIVSQLSGLHAEGRL